MQENEECYFCKKKNDLVVHHVFFGTANRKISEREGFKVWLCPYHHNMSSNSVHQNRKLDLVLKRKCQLEYERNHTREEFIKLIGKSYL